MDLLDSADKPNPANFSVHYKHALCVNNLKVLGRIEV
jgi:hypothetical protein